MRTLSNKEKGAYYTPDVVAESLLRWAIRSESDRLLDPSCGDGQFIVGHRNSVGIEQDVLAARAAVARAPWALVHEGDFFTWASNTEERFECVAGNPPFIRYQTFKGQARDTALDYCASVGVRFSALTSSWAPFIAAASTLLKPGGRMAFVVPAEIGHAPYAAPLLDYLAGRFSVVHVLAIKEKLFPGLSEDCWLLYAEGFGGATETLRFTALEKFRPLRRPPRTFTSVRVAEWRDWKCRLRPFLLDSDARKVYQALAADPSSRRLGEIASVGIGYVTGANDFFHLRPSQAGRLGIPAPFLHPSVRNSRVLPSTEVSPATVANWREKDQEMLLLRLPKSGELPRQVLSYLDSEAGHVARTAYKCRVREPWFSVPDVQVPDFFLAYMSGLKPQLVRNNAGCTCTNSVHSVRLRSAKEAARLRHWGTPHVDLSCELEGHPLGGGMLKLEPREAARVVLPSAAALRQADTETLQEAVSRMRSWRHCEAA